MGFPVRHPETLSHDLLALAFESSDDCIKMLSADGTLLLLNAGGAAAMGFEGPTVPVGQNWIEFWHGEEREAAREALAEAVNGRRSTLRGYLPTATGLPRWWESSLVSLPIAAGEPPRVLVISRDVTGRREAERAKRRSERLYGTLVEATSNIVWTRDLETGDCDSRGWTEFTGSLHDPASFEDWLEAIHPEDREEARRTSRAALRDGRALTIEYRLRSKVGGWRWVEDRSAPVTDDDGAAIAWVGVVTDVHNRRAAAQKLRDEGTKLRLALESASLGTWDVDLSTGRCGMSVEARSMLGLADEVAGCSFIDVLHPEDRDAVLERYHDNIAEEAGMTLTTFRIVRPDTGETRWITSRGRAVLDHEGRPVGRVGTFEDFTDRKQTRDTLRSTLRRYQALLDATSVIVWHSDAAQVSGDRQGWAEFTGISAPAVGDAWLDAIHPDDRARVKSRRDRACAAGESYLNEYRLCHIEGGHRWVRDDVVPLRSDDGPVDGWVGIISDIHERRTAEQALQASEERLRLASEVAGLGTYDVDLVTGHREWSPEFHDLIRVPRNVRPERRLFIDAVHIDDRGRLLDDRLLTEEVHGGLRVSTFRLRSDTGEVRWVEDRERLIFDGEGRPARRIGTMQDVTDRKRVEHELWLAAHADALTGLANRTLFQARVEEAVTRADRHRVEACVLIVDIDRFKEINDTMGHDAGDAVLLAIADRLRRCCPADATVARLGGDEFGVVMSSERDIAAPDVVGEDILSALRRPVMHGGREIECSGSVGWSAYPRHDGDAKALLKNSDVALYAAKKAGRNRVASFDAGMRDDFERRVTVLRSAKDALARDAVLPFYQPKVSLRTGRVVGFEALLRWRDPSGLRSPADLWEAFADPDLACRLGSRMLRCVVEDMRGWTERGVPFGHVALNAGAPELHRHGFADGVLQALAGAGLGTNCLEIEVTEGVLLDDATTAVTKALKHLDDAGVAIALDDFGTGYASLSHLRRFPVSWLKIDRSFVSNMETDNDSRAIIRAVIGLAHSLGLKAVAEGVETPSQMDFLADIGCDLAQGYLLAKPMASATLSTFLAGWKGLRGPGR
ncbi:EAL domain-containing protein [Lichenibacterium minor]|uniref:EAL domain-containing protein n=1 Tax=Lichenibacterium minor TaxID=2316528 RepID=A0A4Q2TXS1_9HYPH|nr:EAL domain-containing protein [Lichenibacterium minor]RYC28873.1 EAL domain-containing protein [Lichenibacterium minor]